MKGRQKQLVIFKIVCFYCTAKKKLTPFTLYTIRYTSVEINACAMNSILFYVSFV